MTPSSLFDTILSILNQLGITPWTLILAGGAAVALMVLWLAIDAWRSRTQ
jgi:hypothetical protein